MIESLNRVAEYDSHFKSSPLPGFFKPEVKALGHEEKVLRYIEQEAESRTVVIPEGSPIYLYPFEDRESQQWTSPAFVNGWKIVNDLSRRLPAEKTKHFILVDDYNNRPEGATKNDLREQLLKMGQSSEILAQSPIFSNNGNFQHAPTYRFLESKFTESNSSNQCSELDAAFQSQKIILQLESGKLSIGEIDRALLVVVHPEDFKQQQQMMLRSLIKESPFQQIPEPKQRRDIISNMYRHVWLDNTGQVTGVTHPVWRKKNFEHKNIL
jgi:hypothetical protein